MTQIEISKLLDVPDRTLRDWKKNRRRLYQLLKATDAEDVKSILGVVDVTDYIEFNPAIYSVNYFWQTDEKSQQTVYSIISNYLGSMNQKDIAVLCKEYGKNMVKYVLNDKYKKIYAKGYIQSSGIDIPLNGTYNKNGMYKELIGIINDC